MAGLPGGPFYNREVALEVLGTDDPAQVQEYVKDWDTFNQTAATLKDAGYTITSSVNDTYRVYSNNVTSKWVALNSTYFFVNTLYNYYLEYLCKRNF